jgi:Beta-lactamase
VLVAHDGRVVLLRGYGQARAEALFDIGSVAKTSRQPPSFGSNRTAVCD